MDELTQAFLLGNAAIIGNVCMLPLYPGMIVMLAGKDGATTESRPRPMLGVFVLAGVLVSMVAIGGLFHLFSAPVSAALPVLVPAVYGLVALLGVAMLFGFNPFARMSSTTLPVLRRPGGSAFVYGAALAPMTLPCTGPLIISAFVIGGVAGTGAFLESLRYFLFFGLGFGWPLVLLPLLAAPFQRRLTRWLARHHRGITVISGLLLLAVAAYGLTTDISIAT